MVRNFILRVIFIINFGMLSVLNSNLAYPMDGGTISGNSKRIYSSINRYEKTIDENNFSFLITGHIHGSSSSQSGMPASTFLANLEMLNSEKFDFMISLGDLFLNVKSDYRNYEKYLFTKLNFPIFNAVGNHDVDNEIYMQRYGTTYFSFEIGKNRFIILDTEIDNGDFKGDQRKMLIDNLKPDDRILNVFIFMHRALWAEDDSELSALLEGNTRSAVSTNFKTEILTELEEASEFFTIHIFSGSIGGMAPSSFLYYSFSEKIKFIATAIRDLPRDAVLRVDCIDGKIKFKTISLNTNEVMELEKYTPEWWRNNMPEPIGFNWRLVPLYIWQMLTHRYFWYGVFYVLLPGITLFFVVRKKYRAKKV